MYLTKRDWTGIRSQTSTRPEDAKTGNALKNYHLCLYTISDNYVCIHAYLNEVNFAYYVYCQYTPSPFFATFQKHAIHGLLESIFLTSPFVGVGVLASIGQCETGNFIRNPWSYITLNIAGIRTFPSLAATEPQTVPAIPFLRCRLVSVTGQRQVSTRHPCIIVSIVEMIT